MLNNGTIASDLLRWSGRRDSNPRPSPWQGEGFCLWGRVEFPQPSLVKGSRYRRLRVNSMTDSQKALEEQPKVQLEFFNNPSRAYDDPR